MKILMICTEKLPVPPIRGGAIQTYISGALPYLSRYHDITVLNVNDPDLPDQETIDGIHYVRIPGKVFEVYKEGVVQYLKSNPFDLIHIFNRPKMVLPVREAAPQARLTLSMHNDMFKPEKIDPEEASKVIDEVSNIVTVSDYIGKTISQAFPKASEKLSTIYSGVDTDRFLPGTHPKMRTIRDQIRDAHGLQDKTVILFAGRLSRNKGVDRLIRALPELAKTFKDLALVIVGSKWFSDNNVTDYVAYVRALAKRLPIPVVNTGFVPYSEIQNWFAAADVFVCTSVWQEPLARVHYEAMAAGLPIVTTARGGNAEVIHGNGLIVENPEDPANFVEILYELLSKPAMMKELGAKGREDALSLFQWDRVADQILEVWEHAHEIYSLSTNDEPYEFEITNAFKEDAENLETQSPAASSLEGQSIELEKEKKNNKEETSKVIPLPNLFDDWFIYDEKSNWVNKEKSHTHEPLIPLGYPYQIKRQPRKSSSLHGMYHEKRPMNETESLIPIDFQIRSRILRERKVASR